MKKNEIVFVGAIAAAIAMAAIFLPNPATRAVNLAAQPAALIAAAAEAPVTPAVATPIAKPAEKPLHAYLMTLLDSLMRAWPDQDEAPDSLRTRLSTFADSIVTAI